MENLNKLIQIRKEIIEKSTNEFTLTEESVLETILPELENAKIIETPEINYSYILQDSFKLNGFDINSTGERLILFIVNSSSIDINLNDEEIMIVSKEFYDEYFNKTINFINQSIKRNIQPPSDKIGILISQLQKNIFIEQIDVIEIIQISLTATIENRGKSISSKNIIFNDENISVNYVIENTPKKKNIIIKKRLIDLNYLKDILIDKSALSKLIVDFRKYTNNIGLKVLEAIKTENFTSYLAVIPATIIADLYKNESTKLLENNVRSFLTFKKDANKGMQRTILNEPEKFIAYNNGLTITATGIEVEKNNNEIHIKQLVDFQIVNGGQTTATIYFTSKEGIDISKVFLMAKINVLTNETSTQLNDQEKLLKFINDISLYSNTQSKVDSVDFASRSEEVKQIKRLSTNIHPPTNDRWFFELMKGEFNTMISLEKNDSRKKKLRELYPKFRVLDIKSIGKYWGAWDDIPYLVKLGGVKFNGVFLKKLQNIGVKNLDRNFYEDTIAKCIIWESFFNIYGSGKNSIGQLRASVVPYSISAIYLFTEGKKDYFNFTKIWKEQKITLDFEIWSKKLMELINELIKKNSTSDNIEDGTKRKELWDTIKTSNELINFFKTQETSKILNDYKKTQYVKNKFNEIDFSDLVVKIEVLDKGYHFYNKLKKVVQENEPDILDKVTRMINKFYTKKGDDFVPQEITFEEAQYIKDLTIKLYNNYDLMKLKQENSNDYLYCLNQIISIYNKCIGENLSIESEFNFHAELAEKKQLKFIPSALRRIGTIMKRGEILNINDIVLLSFYFNENNNNKSFNQEKIKYGSESIPARKKIKYIKKIVSQDIERTPTFSIDAIKTFFNINLKNGDKTNINIHEKKSGKIFNIEIKKRETRDEYRIFLNNLFKEIKPNENDILIFTQSNDITYVCEHIKFQSNSYLEYNYLLSNEKNHFIIED